MTSPNEKESISFQTFYGILMCFVLLCGLLIGFAFGSLVERHSFETVAIASGYGTYVKTEAGGMVFVWKVHACHHNPATNPK